MELRGYVTARNEDGTWYVQSTTFARGKCVGFILTSEKSEALTIGQEDVVSVLQCIGAQSELYNARFTCWL